MGVNINEMRGDEISFTHQDAKTGRYTSFAVTRMTKFIELNRDKVKLYKVPVYVEFAAYIKDNRGVEIHRLLSILDAEHIDPIIMLRMPDDSCLIVDGNHRYMAAAMAKMQFIDAYILEADQWEAFVIDGISEAMAARVLRISSGLDDKGQVPTRYRGD